MIPPSDPVPVLIDCDPGVDDALAIAMAAAIPRLRIVGLTAVFGNADVATTARNAAGLARLVGLDVPVARGAARPLVAAFPGGVPQVHGRDGMGDGGLIDAGTPEGTDDRHAALRLIDLSHRYARRLVIVALGPLTNLAIAAHLDPNLPERVARVVVMGGNAFCPGNATPAAEANMWNDPEAADLALGLGWPITMLGLDVTHRVNLTGVQIDRLARADTPGGLVAREALPLYRAFFERTNGIDGIFCHDPTMFAWLARPDLFTTRALPLRVETQGMSRGRTWPALGDTDDPTPVAWEGRPRIEVGTDCDGTQVAAFVIETLTRV